MSDSTWVSNPEQAIEAVKKQFESLQKKADSVVAKPKQLEKYTDYTSGKYKWSRFDNCWGTYNLRVEYYFYSNSGWGSKTIDEDNLKRTLKQFDKTLEQWKSDNKQAFETNKKIIAFNQEQVEKVKLIMKTIGVTDQYSTWEYKTSRSRNKTETKHRAGYFGDLSRTVTTHDTFDATVNKILERRASIEKYGKAKIEEHRKLAAEEAQKEREKEQLHELALLRAKYTPDDHTSDLYSIREALNSKDKYLGLAYWLERQRGDWSEGYGYAERGLNTFVVETEEDQKIEDEISDLTYNHDGYIDGRVFRDCTYNYSVLYSMVDASLMSDHEKLYTLETNEYY